MMITVIITAHKDRGFLDDAINSAKRQSFEDYEIVLASNNNPSLEKFAKKHKIGFTLYEGDDNKGTNSFNKAISEARGEWIKWLMDDDLLTENCLTDLWKVRENNVLVYGNAMMFRDNGEMRIYKSLPDVDLISLLPIINCPINAATIMFKKEAWHSVGGFDNNLNFSGEYEFYINLLINAGTFGYSDSIVAWYRQHKGQETNRYTAEEREKVKQYIIKKHGF